MAELWQVEMRGKMGYTCSVFISKNNAKDITEAKNLAVMMFPELVFVEVMQ